MKVQRSGFILFLPLLAVLLAAGGLVSGTWAWMRLVRHAEATGLARGSAMLGPEARARAQQHWEG